MNRPGLDAGLMPENLRRLRYHAKHLPADVYITGIDAGGPLNTCKDLLDTNLLYTGFYDDPAAMHHILNMASEVQFDIYQAITNRWGAFSG